MMGVCVFDCGFDGVRALGRLWELSGKGTESKCDLHCLPLDTTGTAAAFPLPHLYFSLPSFCLYYFPSPLCYFPSSPCSSTVGQSHMAEMGPFRHAADPFCVCVYALPNFYDGALCCYESPVRDIRCQSRPAHS